MTEPKAQCSKCGKSILHTTAKATNGLCMPCKQGRKADRKFETHAVMPGRHVDWMLIDITKDRETKDCADYYFSSSVSDKDPRYRSRTMVVGINVGLMRIHKVSGEIELLSSMPEDEGKKRFSRAALVLKKHWQEGQYPEKTVFACG